MKIESTNNLHIQKFIHTEVFFKGSEEFDAESEKSDFQLVETLLQFPFVKKILISGDFVAIEKTENVDWDFIQDSLSDVISEGIQTYIKQKRKNLPIEVYLEQTPNPEVVKMVTNALLYDGMAEAKNKSEVDNFPLAEELLNLEYVEEVFVSENYISLTKKKSEDWKDYQFEIRDIISSYLRSGKDIVTENYQPKIQEEKFVLKEEYTEIEQQIKQILEEYIKPTVANDGGNIELIEFEEETKTAKMLLQGACSGCPSSTMTLKNGIETMLKQMLEGKVENVIAVNG